MRLLKILMALISSIIGLSLIAFVGVSYSVTSLENNITVIDTNQLANTQALQDALAASREELQNDASLIIDEPATPLTIALVGSDTRAGQGAGFGKESGARSDTTVIIKLNAERTNAVVISIARDLRVDIPACEKFDGTATIPQSTKFNAAYAFGGANCMLATIRENFGIEVDHIAVVDFLGFQEIVNIIGGVEVCVAKDVRDDSSNLNLKAGRQTLMGEEALAFVRARKNLGDGSDISRNERQRLFLASALRTAESNGTFYDLGKLYNILQEISKSLSMDQELASVGRMVEIAVDVRSIGSKNIQLISLPWSSNGDGTIRLKQESYAILDKFNAAEFPILSEKQIKLPKENLEEDDIDATKEEIQYEKLGFSADLDMCEANIR